MMCEPNDSRWNEETGNSEGIFSQQTAILYTDTRKDLEEILNNVQACLDKVPVCDISRPGSPNVFLRSIFLVHPVLA